MLIAGINDDEASLLAILAGYEGGSFDLTGGAKEDILAIASVHPMREAPCENSWKKQ